MGNTKVKHPFMLHINEPVPTVSALTTDDTKSLVDYRGKWLALLSHPDDFTPVCTTAFTADSKQPADFEVINY